MLAALPGMIASFVLVMGTVCSPYGSCPLRYDVPIAFGLDLGEHGSLYNVYRDPNV